MEDKVKAILADVLDVEVTEIGNDFGPDSADNWDSLRNLQLVTAIESEFDISLTMDEIQTMTSFAEIVDVIKSHLV